VKKKTPLTPKANTVGRGRGKYVAVGRDLVDADDSTPSEVSGIGVSPMRGNLQNLATNPRIGLQLGGKNGHQDPNLPPPDLLDSRRYLSAGLMNGKTSHLGNLFFYIFLLRHSG
jgi:hypothetical protein